MVEQVPSKDLSKERLAELIDDRQRFVTFLEAGGGNPDLGDALDMARDTVAALKLLQSAHEPRADLPKPINHDLWRHLHDEHGLTLLQSELDEILRIAQPPGAKGDDNTNTAADRPSAITAGEAAASDGDFACPVVSPSSRAQVALRAIYDATAEDGLHENKALFDVAREGLGYSTSTKPDVQP